MVFPRVGPREKLRPKLWNDIWETLDGLTNYNPLTGGANDQYQGWNNGVPALLRLRSVDPTHPRWGGGAVMDGVTDSTEQVYLASMYLATTGGQMELPPGTLLVSPKVIAGHPGSYGCVQIPNKSRIVGSGMEATTIKLKNGVTQNNYVVVSNTGLGGGDAGQGVADLTIDGNGANNANNAIIGQGLAFMRARSVRVDRVRVKDVHGYAYVPPGETFHAVVSNCVDVVFSECETTRTAGATATGFGDNASTNVIYSNCIAWGMTVAHGFSSWEGSNIVFDGSIAYLNAQYGFNMEVGTNITLTGCHAGGIASDQADGSAGLTASQSLGNGQSGFTSYGSKNIHLNGCHASRNGSSGLMVSDAGLEVSTAHVNGGSYTHNAQAGINYLHSGSVTGSTISPDTVIANNTTTQVGLPSPIGYIANTQAILPTPTVPASGVALVNPFPFAVNIILTNTNTYFMQIGPANIGMGAAGNHTIPLPYSASITANYGTAPTWIWLRA